MIGNVGEQQLFSCGHRACPVTFVGDPPYPVPVPSQGGTLCPACFLADCHESQFFEHEQRLNLGKLDGSPSDVWFSMLLRQRQVVLYETSVRSRTDLSTAAQDRLLSAFLEAVREISKRYPTRAWQAFSTSHEPAFQDMEEAFLQALLAVLLSGAPIPTCDCLVTLKMVDITPIEQGHAEEVSLPTLDAWPVASYGRPLVLVCRKTLSRRIPGGGGYYRELTDERVGYLVEDPATLQFLWAQTRREFQKPVIADGKVIGMTEEPRPVYALDSPRVIRQGSFLVKPSFCVPFGLSWCYYHHFIAVMDYARWIDDVWDYAATPDYLQFATDVRLDGAHGDFPPLFHLGETTPLCLYCAQPIDLSHVSTGGAGIPDCCAGCSYALRLVPSFPVHAQRVRRRQLKALSPLGPTPALCDCLHHQASQCTQRKYGRPNGFLPCRCACHTGANRQPVAEESWSSARQAWEVRLRAWFNGPT